MGSAKVLGTCVGPSVGPGNSCEKHQKKKKKKEKNGGFFNKCLQMANGLCFQITSIAPRHLAALMMIFVHVRLG